MKTLKMRLAASAALVLGLVFAASATTYYVDASRPDNNDDGLSEATAKRDIFAAINISAAGDLILVKPGTYTSTLSAHLDHALTIRAAEGPEKTFIRTESQAINTFNGTTEPVFDGFTLSSKADSWAIWGGTYTNCVIAFCRGQVGGAKFFRSTIACNDLALRSDAVIGPDCLVWGNPVKTETEPNPCFLDPENFDFRLRASSPEAYTNPRLGYYQGSLIEGLIVRVAVDGAGKLEGELFNLVAVGGNITLKCATTSPRSVERWLDENGETIVNGGDYELSADSLTIKNVTADRRITACFERKTWYVNADTGADAGNNGLSEGAPFKTIAKALASALDLDTILVAEGTYVEGYDEIDDHKYPKLRVTNGRHLTIRATGARETTIIDGGNETSCLWLNDKQVINTNVVVEGFTLQNGQASWLTGVGAIGGGAFGGLLRNCTIRNCTAGSGNSGMGGGAYYARLENCTVTGCKAHSEGGALRRCDAEGCVITGNSMGGTSSSARGCATVYGTLVNCLIADNEFKSTVVSGSGAVYQSELYGCTVAGNRNNASSNRNGAGVYGESSYTKLFNTIVYGNVSDGQPDELQNVDSADLATCCTNDPSFKDAASGDYRLLPTSVCHNAGKNSYVTGAFDLAGHARIQEWTVDLGAYEYCPIMTITAEPTQATAGTPYSYTLTQTGGGEPVAWTIDDAIPEGISLSGNQLVGTPTKGGSYSFRVTAREAGGETQSKIVTMDVLSNYTLKFDGNGNKTGTAPGDKSLTSVEEYVLPEPGMACGCARFLGWATNATGAAVYQPGDAVKGLCAEPNGIVTLYAVWEDVFVVQFDLNAENVLGGHQSYTNTTGASFFVYRTDGSTNVVDYGNSSREAPCRIGWTLDCWNTEADGSGTKVCQNGAWSEKVSAATFGADRGDVVTLYAQWQKSAWSFFVPDPQLGEGKWWLNLEGDDSAVLGNVYGTVTWPESLTLPAAYRGRTVSSLTSRLQYFTGADLQNSVKHLVIPEGYTNLCANAFQYLYALESISFPSTLAAIPDYCCYNCTNLASIAFAEGNRSVGSSAFYACAKLTEVEIPRGLTELRSSAFSQCTGLTKVTLSPDYVGSTSTSQQFQHSPIAKLEIPASCLGFGWNALQQTAALRFLGNRPTWNVNNANLGYAQLIEYPATNTTWNAGPIANYSTKPHKGFVGPIAAFGVTDAYFWTNANETVTFAYAESPLAATVTLPEGAISWGGVEWEIVGFEPDAFDGQPTTVYYPISEYAKWEQATPPEGITLAPTPGTFFTLTFDANGGDTYVPATMAFPPSGVRTLPSATPTRSAYLFLGWAETSDGAATYQPGDDYTAGAAGGSATLYAKWEEVGNYTLHFEGNSTNATGVPDDIVTAVGTTPAIPADPAREGWTFAGWTNVVNATVYQAGNAFDEGCAANSTFTLYAKWTSTTVSNQEFVDGNGSTWTYDRTGDAVTLTGFTPGATATGYTKPSTINGGTVVNRDTFDPKTEYVNGLWWTYMISGNKAMITDYSGTVPANLAIPGTLGGKPVVGFGVQSLFVSEDSLVSVEFPATFEQIYRYVFSACANLETVIFHEGLTTMHDSFNGCPKLNEINFPASFTHFDNAYCFHNSGTNRPFDENGLRYADTAHEIVIAVDPELEGELVLPEGVRLCTYYVFRDNTKVTSAVLPSTLKLRWNLFYSSAVTAVSVDASVEREGTGTAESTLITDVFVRGGAPSWNLKDYFTGLTTIHYDAKYAAEWKEYKAAHPAINYDEVLTEEPTGRHLKTDLVNDLGIEIPGDVDYALGDKVTVKVEGLAKGLKVVATQQKEATGKKAVTNVVYTIEGVPTEAIDFETRPMYARVTTTYKDKTKGDKGKVETLQPIVLSIATPEPSVLTAGVLNQVYGPADIATLWPEVADAKVNPRDWTFKGWPAGLKYNATAKDASWSYKKDGATVRTNAEPWTVYGQPTKAGEYPITATWKHKLDDNKTTVSETFSAVLTVWGDDGASDFRYEDQAYVATATKTLDATYKSFTGLPTGIKWTAKPVTTKNKDMSVTTNVVAYSLYGTPTKAGVFAVTVTKTDNTKETFLWKVAPATAPTFALDTGTAPVEDLKAQIVQGANQSFAIATSEGAKVTVTGLPSGLKLVQDKTTGLYSVEGVASKPGEYFVTFKTTLNGVTTVTTTAFTVKGNPFTAAYYGCALARPATNEAYRLAVAEVTVAAAGTVKLTYTEGKTKYTASVKSFDWNDTTGKGTAEGLVLKVSSADKQHGYGDRKATVTLEDCGVYLRAKLIVNDANGSQIGESIGGMYATVKTTEVPLPASQTFVFRTEDGVDTNAFATVSLAYDANKATAAFSGKLYDGTAVKATVPVMRWDDDGKAWDYAFVPFLVVAKDGTVCCFNCFTDDDGGCINWVCDDGEWTEGVWSPDVDYPHADKKFAELVPEEGAFTFGWGSDAEIVGAAEESFMFEQTLDAKGKPAGVAIYDADAVEGEKPLATVTAKVGKATGAISVSFTSKKGDKAKYAVELVWRGEQIFAGHVTRTWKELVGGKSANLTAYGTAEVK